MIFVRFLQAIFGLLWADEKTEILNFQDTSRRKPKPEIANERFPVGGSAPRKREIRGFQWAQAHSERRQGSSNCSPFSSSEGDEGGDGHVS